MRSQSSDRQVGLLRASDADRTLPGAFAQLAELEYRLGDWPAAHASALESLRAAQAAGLGREAMTSLALLASIEAGVGRSHACRRHAAHAIELNRRHRCVAVEALAGQALGFLELGLGRVDAAIGRLERVAGICANHADACAAATTWAHDLAEAYLRRGDGAGARRSLSRLEEQASQSGSYVLAAALDRSLAMLAADDTFERLFQRAFAWNARAQQPFEQARTELCFGERLRRARRPREAQARVYAALETFDALGARPWADRARDELSAAGRYAGYEPVPADDRSFRRRREHGNRPRPRRGAVGKVVDTSQRGR